MSHSFDAFVLLISIPSEISIPSYSSIYNSYKHSDNIHSSKKIADNIYHFLEKYI